MNLIHIPQTKYLPEIGLVIEWLGVQSGGNDGDHQRFALVAIEWLYILWSDQRSKSLDLSVVIFGVVISCIFTRRYYTKLMSFRDSRL